jgi:hypothetical protein
MKTPVETNALYLIVAAIPLLHGLDRDFVDSDDNSVAARRHFHSLSSAPSEQR